MCLGKNSDSWTSGSTMCCKDCQIAKSSFVSFFTQYFGVFLARGDLLLSGFKGV